jgi:hypothetical protein
MISQTAETVPTTLSLEHLHQREAVYRASHKLDHPLVSAIKSWKKRFQLGAPNAARNGILQQAADMHLPTHPDPGSSDPAGQAVVPGSSWSSANRPCAAQARNQNEAMKLYYDDVDDGGTAAECGV